MENVGSRLVERRTIEDFASNAISNSMLEEWRFPTILN